jgi:predicted Rossmann fold nucleotide-binding protein DprA/Smf involved in DNA uptake
MIRDPIGNRDILKTEKTTFFCSRRCPASVVLLSYDWAKQMRRDDLCVISGNHSQIEKDVVHYLLKGKQPIILALARGLKKRLDPKESHALRDNRLLIITPFGSGVTRASQDTANKRDEFMAELADEIFVSFAEPEGNVERLVIKWLKKGKKVKTFDVTENRALIDAGVEILKDALGTSG